ncbi:MAG: CGNR zinc finger domain-containing protein [Acidothermaceae bacterium]
MPPRILVPLIGEPLPLDLVNTRPQPDRGVADTFATVDGLAQWLVAESDRLPTVRVTDGTRRAVVQLREHVGFAVEAIMAARRPPAASLDCINDSLRRAPSVPQLRWSSAGGQVDTIRSGDHDAQLLATIAEFAAEYLVSDLALSTRQCEAPDCEMLFSPTHPRRRWCSPTVCGNRTRVARYYERHREEISR